MYFDYNDFSYKPQETIEKLQLLKLSIQTSTIAQTTKGSLCETIDTAIAKINTLVTKGIDMKNYQTLFDRMRTAGLDIYGHAVDDGSWRSDKSPNECLEEKEKPFFTCDQGTYFLDLKGTFKQPHNYFRLNDGYRAFDIAVGTQEITQAILPLLESTLPLWDKNTVFKNHYRNDEETLALVKKGHTYLTDLLSTLQRAADDNIYPRFQSNDRPKAILLQKLDYEEIAAFETFLRERYLYSRIAAEMVHIIEKIAKPAELSLTLTQQTQFPITGQNIYGGECYIPTISDTLKETIFSQKGYFCMEDPTQIYSDFRQLIEELISKAPKDSAAETLISILSSRTENQTDLLTIEKSVAQALALFLEKVPQYNYDATPTEEHKNIMQSLNSVVAHIVGFFEAYLSSCSRNIIPIPEGLADKLPLRATTDAERAQLDDYVRQTIMMPPQVTTSTSNALATVQPGDGGLSKQILTKLATANNDPEGLEKLQKLMNLAGHETSTAAGNSASLFPHQALEEGGPGQAAEESENNTAARNT